MHIRKRSRLQIGIDRNSSACLVRKRRSCILKSSHSNTVLTIKDVYLNKRVAKYFSGRLYFGTVTDVWNYNYENPTMLLETHTLDSNHRARNGFKPLMRKLPFENPWNFAIEYDDGDSEDMTLPELRIAMQEAERHQKVKQLLDTPREYWLHTRVAKLLFNSKVNFGDIVGYDRTSYRIQFGNGTVETWESPTVLEGKLLFQTYCTKTTKTLWELYDINPTELASNWSKRRHPWPKSFVENATIVAKFYLFLLERQRIWIRRKAYQWEQSDYLTTDPILRNYSFCNVYRQLDQGTNYFHAHVLVMWSNFGRSKRSTRIEWFVQVLWAAYCYRLVNRTDSFQYTYKNKSISVPWIPTLKEWPQFKKQIIELHVKRGEVFFTGAHQTCGFDRYLAQVDTVHADPIVLWEVARNCSSLSECYNAIISKLPGCGQFLSWQLVCDLVESNCFTEQAKDSDFCVLGSGAKAGIQHLFQPKLKKVVGFKAREYLELTKMLVEYQDVVYANLGTCGELRFPQWQGHRLTTKEMEHALCEFQKYLQVESDLTRSTTTTRMRLRKPRLQTEDACRNCFTKIPITDRIVCDTCSKLYCYSCETSRRDRLSWVCGYCRDLARYQWDG